MYGANKQIKIRISGNNFKQTKNNLQFHFLPPSNTQTSGPVFIIDDGSQPKIELSSKDRNVIAATFTHFLLKNIGGSETFKDKQDFFYHEVCEFLAMYQIETKSRLYL